MALSAAFTHSISELAIVLDGLVVWRGQVPDELELAGHVRDGWFIEERELLAVINIHKGRQLRRKLHECDVKLG